jgi:alpha-mannosidase
VYNALEQSELPEWYGELYLELHRGTLTTMAEVKAQNRKIEQELRKLELMLTYHDPSKLDQVTALWKRELLH